MGLYSGYFGLFWFSTKFIYWISCTFESGRISIQINGASCDYFGCFLGVRQGDPLSPLLFVLVEDILSKYLTSLSEQGKLHPISSPRSVKAPTHFLFANDVLLFSLLFRLSCNSF